MAGWEQRQLCADGACIGVIGDDGTCKVCGRAAPNWGDERNRGLTPLPAEAPVDRGGDAPADDDELADDPADDEDEDNDEDEGDDEDDEAGFADDDRTLCSDGACIGVIGPGGTCNTCGKPAAA